MIGLKRVFVAAVSLASLALVVSLVAPREGFGAGNANGQQPQPKVAYDSTITLPFTVADASANTVQGNFAPVPAGKQLIVTFASGWAHLSSATNASFRVLKAPNGAVGLAGPSVIHELKPVVTHTVGGVVAAEPLQIVVNSNDLLTGIVSRDDTSNADADVGMTISGYLVDVPGP